MLIVTAAAHPPKGYQVRYHISVPGQMFWEGSHSLKVWPGSIYIYIYIYIYQIHLMVASTMEPRLSGVIGTRL